jgi:hypothetical protein
MVAVIVALSVFAIVAYTNMFMRWWIAGYAFHVAFHRFAFAFTITCASIKDTIGFILIKYFPDSSAAGNICAALPIPGRPVTE